MPTDDVVTLAGDITVGGWDIAIICGYLVFILLAGIYLTRLASRSIRRPWAWS